MKADQTVKAKYKRELSYEDLIKVFIYNPIEGSIVKRKNPKPLNFAEYEGLYFLEFRIKKNPDLKGSGQLYHIPVKSLAWMLHYQVWPDDVVVSRDFDHLNLKISNLMTMPWKEFRRMLSAWKNYNENCKVRKHPEDQYKFLVRYTEDGKTYRKIFSDSSVAERYALNLKHHFVVKLRRFGCVL